MISRHVGMLIGAVFVIAVGLSQVSAQERVNRTMKSPQDISSKKQLDANVELPIGESFDKNPTKNVDALQNRGTLGVKPEVLIGKTAQAATIDRAVLSAEKESASWKGDTSRWLLKSDSWNPAASAKKIQSLSERADLSNTKELFPKEEIEKWIGGN